jgi:hypothetical protein
LKTFCACGVNDTACTIFPHFLSHNVLLNVGLYFAQTTLFWFSKINATCACWIPRRGIADLLLPENVGTKTLAWDINNCVLSPYTSTHLFRARFPSLTAQQAWAGFFQVQEPVLKL